MGQITGSQNVMGSGYGSKISAYNQYLYKSLPSFLQSQ